MTTGFETVTPYLCVRDAAAALEFYRAVFGAEELFRLTDPGDGRIGHAEFRIGESVLFLADEYPDFGALGPDTLGGSPVALHLQVSDCDKVLAAAEAAGALVLRRPADQSFGERLGQVQDPWGHRWFIAQKIEEVAPTEMQRRWEAETGA
ncbi:glyxoylase [Pseudooceanicola lipolyticus]|uniref:Glyxoylase n=1 Tax=Pseudooceanicola lipolyticus TaxID=2029104 RepID=A0A2M8J162_9RHOB|nr:VOC family protein [Pseudooceanicola lipolyticus]PJE36519.1 glyxoylase [Pseudooceanicola lipolyticus]